jgi:hypothetical protein
MSTMTKTGSKFGRIERRAWCVVSSHDSYQAGNPTPSEALV